MFQVSSSMFHVSGSKFQVVDQIGTHMELGT